MTHDSLAQHSVPNQYTTQQLESLQQADELKKQADRLINDGKPDDAIPLLEQALKIKKQVLGDENLKLLDAVEDLAIGYIKAKRYNDAKNLFQQTLSKMGQNLNKFYRDNPDAFNFVSTYDRQLLSHLEPFFNTKQHIDIEEISEELVETYKDLPQVEYTPAQLTLLEKAAQLSQQADHLSSIGKLNEALKYDELSLQIQRQALGEKTPKVMKSIEDLAGKYLDVGRYGDAEFFYKKVLEETKINLSRISDDETLNNSFAGIDSRISQLNLMSLYVMQERYDDAEVLLQQFLEIYQHLPGNKDLLLAKGYENFSIMYLIRELDREAELNLKKAIYFYRQHLNKLKQSRLNESEENWSLLSEYQSPSLANCLDSLALLYMKQARYSEAEISIKESLKTRKEAVEAYENFLESNSLKLNIFFANQFFLPKTIGKLAILYEAQENFSEAKSFYKQAIDIYLSDSLYPMFAKRRGVASNLAAIGRLYYKEKNGVMARDFFTQSLELLLEEDSNIKKEAVISNTIYHDIVIIYSILEDDIKAVAFLKKKLDLEEDYLIKNLSFGSEIQKRSFISKFSESTYFAISYHFQAASKNIRAARLSLTTILRRKGRTLDVLTESLQKIRQNLALADQQLLDELINIRQNLATLIFQSQNGLLNDKYKTNIFDLQKRAEQLDATLNNRNVEFRQQSQPVTIESIQKHIESDAVLIEMVRYEPANLDEFGSGILSKPQKSRYAAYILHSQGEPQWVDLGEADKIDQKVDQFRRLIISSSRVEQFQQTARELDALVMQPIRTHLGNTRKILLSPDGQLNLVPFAALIDEHNHYLVENYEINYLTSGRDLLRLQNQPPSREPPLIVANPDFDHPGSPSSVVASNQSQSTVTAQDFPRSPDNRQRSRDLSTLKFGALPGTQAEASAIKSKIPDATLLTNTEATENALKQVKAPKILHISTHGFFLQDQPLPSFTEQNRGLNFLRADFASSEDSALPRFTPPPANIENSLLRSGLALAGFNLRQSGNEDGVLTALEAAGLDLRGTQLVVLSACETGVGDIATGEGVYGLRRAFVIAGAASQLFSLWKVDDLGTKELMVKYYDRLLANEGRSAALRSVQLELLQSKRYSHPFYWAAFIPSGDWRPLEK